MNMLGQRLAKIYQAITFGDAETARQLAQSMAEFERMRQGVPITE